MADYFFIQGQDPFHSRRSEASFALIRQLAAAGDQVSVLLVQSAVVIARKAVDHKILAQLRGPNISLFADAFGLQQHAIRKSQVADDVQIVDVDTAVTALNNGAKVIWN